MRTILQSLSRDHREIEALLRALEKECDLFSHAVRPDYDLLGELLDCLSVLLDSYHHPRERVLFALLRERCTACAPVIGDISTEQTGAAENFEALRTALRDILNEQRVSRDAFAVPARAFIARQRQEIALEEQSLFPLALARLQPDAWPGIGPAVRAASRSVRGSRIRERLRSQRRWVTREVRADWRAGRTSR
jgi:hemerythrin-like domain-containing protein